MYKVEKLSWEMKLQVCITLGLLEPFKYKTKALIVSLGNSMIKQSPSERRSATNDQPVTEPEWMKTQIPISDTTVPSI